MPILINRVPPLPNESLQSYLYRLGIANHYTDKTTWYANIIGQKIVQQPNYIRRLDYLERIAEMACIEPNVVQNMVVHRFARIFSEPDIERQGTKVTSEFTPLYYSQIPIWFSNVWRRIRLCPLCWMENNALLLPWIARIATTCPIHKICLIERCSFCGTLLTMPLNKCNSCGLPMSMIEIQSIAKDPESLALTNIVWRHLGSINKQIYLKERKTDIPLLEMSAYSHFTFLRAMGIFLSQFDSQNPRLMPSSMQRIERGSRHYLKVDCYTLHLHLVEATNFIVNWPDAWFETIERLSSQHQRTKETNQDNPRFFPKLAGYLSGTKWNWFWQATRTHIQRRKFLDYNARLQRTQHSAPLSKDESSIRYFSLLDFQSALKLLGVRRAWLAAMIENGLISTVSQGKQPWSREQRFEQKDLEEQLQQLIGHVLMSTPLNGRPIRLTLGHVLYTSQEYGLGIVDFLTAIQSRTLTCHRKTDRLKISELWFDKTELTKFRYCWLNPETNEPLTVRRVMAILNVSLATLKDLNRSSRLIPYERDDSNDYKCWTYQITDIQAFRAKNVNAREAAKIIGVSPKELYMYVKNGRLRNCGYKSLHDYYSYIERAVVIAWRHKHMTTNETLHSLGISLHSLEELIHCGKLVPVASMPKYPPWFRRSHIENLLNIGKANSMAG